MVLFLKVITGLQYFVNEALTLTLCYARSWLRIHPRDEE